METPSLTVPVVRTDSTPNPPGLPANLKQVYIVNPPMRKVINLPYGELRHGVWALVQMLGRTLEDKDYRVQYGRDENSAWVKTDGPPTTIQKIIETWFAMADPSWRADKKELTFKDKTLVGVPKRIPQDLENFWKEEVTYASVDDYVADYNPPSVPSPGMIDYEHTKVRAFCECCDEVIGVFNEESAELGRAIFNHAQLYHPDIQTKEEYGRWLEECVLEAPVGGG